jgi:hypothetical protein
VSEDPGFEYKAFRVGNLAPGVYTWCVPALSTDGKGLRHDEADLGTACFGARDLIQLGCLGCRMCIL